MSNKQKYVILTEGLGNRMMHIFNFLHQLQEVIFIWQQTTYIGSWQCTWEDLFEYPKLNIIYSETLPKQTEAEVICFNNIDFNDSNIKWPLLIDYTNPIYSTPIKQFINELVPSKEVLRHMFMLPKNTIGHCIRVCHPNSRLGRKPNIEVPKQDFLATDSYWVRKQNFSALQTAARGAPYQIKNKKLADIHPNLRNRSGCITATADWLMLFQCSKIYEYGTYFKEFADTKRSLFLDAHRIYGINIVNKTQDYDINKEAWNS